MTAAPPRVTGGRKPNRVRTFLAEAHGGEPEPDAEMPRQLPVLFRCDDCPAYCCTYERIIVHDDDVRRLARRFGIPPERARERFTKDGWEAGERVLRHRKDNVFPSACRFLDRETRACTVYEDRPSICREFPGGRRCGYYDFLSFEREVQEDPELVIGARVHR